MRFLKAVAVGAALIAGMSGPVFAQSKNMTAQEQANLKLVLDWWREVLQAGHMELAPKYMPSGYNIASINRIRKAVGIARAERIGHGVDVLGETDPTGLLTLLKQKGVMVEIGLSSNIQILEVSGKNHPLSSYLASGVPVALATDDQAVSLSLIHI